jgi:tRNA pseudouridine38-40 synthase
MTTFKVTLEYDGTRYSGWQEQKNARTIMGEIRQAAQQVFEGKFEMQGAGRTDAGVHALGQVMHIKTASEVRHHLETIRNRLNDLLPADIAILSVERAAPNFHARHDAASRIYLYQISQRKQAFIKRYVWWVKDPLNTGKMSEAASLLVGRRDFNCFRASDPSRPHESTIVDIEAAAIETEDEIIQFRIAGSHFLWRMVRRIMGTLVKVGAAEITVADFEQLVDGRSDAGFDVAAWTAPASGLFLEEIRYNDRR